MNARQSRRSIVLLLALLALSVTMPPSAAAAEPPERTKYVMSFTRHALAGYRQSVTCNYKRTQTGAEQNGGRQLGRVTLTAHLEGTETTLAVTKGVGAAKISLNVTRFSYRVDGGAEQSIPAGRTITAEVKDGKTVFAIDEGQLPKEAVAVLNEFMRLPTDAAQSADDRFGTREPRSVGDEWPISAAATASAFRKVGSNVDEKDVKGRVKLQDVRNLDGTPCLIIDSDYTASNVAPNVPQADRADMSSDFRERAVITLPVDTSKGRIAATIVTEWTSRCIWHPKDGNPEPIVEATRTEFEQHCTPIEPAQ